MKAWEDVPLWDEMLADPGPVPGEDDDEDQATDDAAELGMVALVRTWRDSANPRLWSPPITD